MKCKIGDTIYDGEEQPVMVILTPTEREQITAMGPEATRYCTYPDTPEWTDNEYKKIKEWMEVDDHCGNINCALRNGDLLLNTCKRNRCEHRLRNAEEL